MNLLCYLVENRDRMVTREQILDAVWHGQVVADDVLNVAISNLRKSLGDDTKNPKYIKTVPRKGYQIVADVMSLPNRTSLFRLQKTAVISVVLLLLGWFFFQGTQDTKHSRVKIAVLPFEFFAADQTERYVADGLTEAIINQLAQEERLLVTSRTSVMQFREQQPSVAEIGKQLDVTWILEGSVQLEKQHMQVTAQLIEVATDKHIWSESYTRERNGLFAIQNDMAKQIAARFVQPSPNRPKSVNPIAYDHYLQGRYHQHQFELDQAEAQFQLALAESNDYAVAYAGLAQLYFLRAFGGKEQSRGYIDQAAEYATKAYALDPDHAYTNLNRALAYFYGEQNYAEADKLFARAFKLNHQDGMIMEWYVSFLLTTKQFSYAETVIKHMREVSPLVYNKTSQYLTLYYAQKYAAALDEVAAISPYMNNPNFFSYTSAWIYLAQGDVTQLNRLAPQFLAAYNTPEQSITTFQQLLTAEGVEAALAYLLAIKGAELGDFEKAELLAWQGNPEAAIELLAQMVKHNDLRAYKIHIEPAFRTLHDQPAFKALLQALKLDSI